jgi:spermidine/putrescine transport system substrate-binding protein
MSVPRRSTRSFVLLLSGCLVVVVAAALAGCGEESDSPSPAASVAPSAAEPTELSGVVSVFSYEDGIIPQVLGPFQKANPDLTIRKAAFSTNDEAVVKMRGGFKVDVVNVCVEETPRMVKMGLLQPLDTSRVVEWDKVIEAVRNMGGVVIDGQVYMVPCTGGTAGVLYNPEVIPNGVTSWKQLFEDPALKGKITMEDTPATGIPIAALALGYEDPFNLTDEDLQKIEDYLIAHKDQLRTFFSGDANFISLYKSGEIAAGFAWHDYAWTIGRLGLPVEYVVPEEGQLAWVCGFGIGTDAENVDNAYGLINYYNTAECEAWYAKNYTYWVFNEDAPALLPEKLVTTIGLDDPEQLQQAIPLVIPENYDAWLKVWQTFKQS